MKEKEWKWWKIAKERWNKGEKEDRKKNSLRKDVCEWEEGKQIINNNPTGEIFPIVSVSVPLVLIHLVHNVTQVQKTQVILQSSLHVLTHWKSLLKNY